MTKLAGREHGAGPLAAWMIVPVLLLVAASFAKIAGWVPPFVPLLALVLLVAGAIAMSVRMAVGREVTVEIDGDTLRLGSGRRRRAVSLTTPQRTFRPWSSKGTGVLGTILELRGPTGRLRIAGRDAILPMAVHGGPPTTTHDVVLPGDVFMDLLAALGEEVELELPGSPAGGPLAIPLEPLGSGAARALLVDADRVELQADERRSLAAAPLREVRVDRLEHRYDVANAGTFVIPVMRLDLQGRAFTCGYLEPTLLWPGPVENLRDRPDFVIGPVHFQRLAAALSVDARPRPDALPLD